MDVLDHIRSAVADRYRIERELGAGGMATVYLALDLRHDRKVAIKILKPELAAVLGAERFVVEIKTTAALQHPHILPLFDSGEAFSHPERSEGSAFLYYVMPYLQGETIREKLNREIQFGVDEAVRIAREVADALDYAHRHGVIHRDIKPENILLHDGRAMVMDFGIALAVSAAAGGRMTETGLSLGTPHYMSPEQATAEREITARSDVYSLASVLYEMLTGDPPFTASSAQAVIMKIITEQPAPVTTRRRSVPPNVAAALAKALEKLPADRFSSAAEFARALVDPAYSGAGTTLAPIAGSSRTGRRRLELIGAAVVSLVVGAATSAAVARQKSLPLDVVRFPVPMPASQRLNNNSSYDMPFILSPDGKDVAYIAYDSNASVGRVHLRHLEQLTTVSLPGTDDAIDPFFSPDGKWIGFITQRDYTLRKIPVTGGPVSIVANSARIAIGAPSWGDDNSILYVSVPGDLVRIGAGGASPETLLVGEKFGSIAAPRVLPGSRVALLTGCSKPPGQRSTCVPELFALDIRTRKVTPLVDGGIRGWYLPDGYLIFGTTNGALYGVSFDLGKLKVTGAPVAVLDGFMTGRARSARVSIAAQSGAMVYLPGTTSPDAVVVQVDRSGREQVIVAKPGDYSAPRLSPDGRRILMEMPDARGSRQVWVHDRSSTTTTQLTFDGQNMRPGWSPDGGRIAFSTSRVEGKNYIWSMPSDGSESGERAGSGPGLTGAGPASWTHDGKWIITDGVADGQTGLGPNGASREDIFAIPTSGSTRTMRPVVATPANEQVGEVSPDGKWIAYVADDAANYQVFVQPFLHAGGRVLISLGTAGEPAWASNDELTYVNRDADSMVIAHLQFGPTTTVKRTTLFDSRPYQLGGTSVRGYDLARDGRSFLFVRPVGQRAAAEPVIVLNWREEVRRLMTAAAAKP